MARGVLACVPDGGGVVVVRVFRPRRVVIPMRVYEALNRMEHQLWDIREYERAKVDRSLMEFSGSFNKQGRCNNCGTVGRGDLHLTEYGSTAAYYYDFCNWQCLSHWAQARENMPVERPIPTPDMYELPEDPE